MVIDILKFPQYFYSTYIITHIRKIEKYFCRKNLEKFVDFQLIYLCNFVIIYKISVKGSIING